MVGSEAGQERLKDNQPSSDPRPAYRMMHLIRRNLNGLDWVKAKGSVTTGPTLGSYKGAVVFARAMFQKCSVFTSQLQTEDQEGRKHLLPVEEVHFLKNKRRLALFGEQACCTPNGAPGPREKEKLFL